MSDNPDHTVIAILRPSQARRCLGVGMVSALGLLLVWLSISTPGMPALWRTFLLFGGAGALYAAQLMWRGTMQGLELTRTELREEGGRVLAVVAEIEHVERGAFAFKPSNGFVIRTKSRAARAWTPGLWWRFGRRVGVGGVTAASEAKFMAETISLLLNDPEQLDGLEDPGGR